MTNAYIIKVVFIFLKVICDKVNSVRMTLSLHNKAKQPKQTNKQTQNSQNIWKKDQVKKLKKSR